MLDLTSHEYGLVTICKIQVNSVTVQSAPGLHQTAVVLLAKETLSVEHDLCAKMAPKCRSFLHFLVV